MKRFLLLVTLLCTSWPVLASSHRQPGSYSQFHIQRKPSHHANNRRSQPALHDSEARWSAHLHMASIPKDMRPRTARGRFRNSVRPFSTPANPAFLSASRSLLGGADDDETAAVMGDFNGDGKLDVAKLVVNLVGQTNTVQIAVSLGNGDGTFAAPQLMDSPGGVDGPLVVGDLNGDGKDDLIVVQPSEPGAVYALLSNGDGTFTATNGGDSFLVTDVSLIGGVLTDVNGDGKLDVLALDDSNPTQVIELLGNGDGTFQAATTAAALTGSAPNGPFFADFNGDGKLDIAGEVNSHVAVYLASSGSFAAPVSLLTSNGAYNSCYNATGDLNGDGKPEIVSVNCQHNTVTVYVNNGDGTFQSGLDYDITSDQYFDASAGTIADVDGDGKNDVVLVSSDSGEVVVLRGNGNGALTTDALGYDTGGSPYEPPLVADFNGDGLLDVVVADDEYNLVYLQGYGDGSFRAAPVYSLPNSFSSNAYTGSVATGDFNGDGVADIVAGNTRNSGDAGVVVYLSKGDGTLAHGVAYGTSTSMFFVTTADFNGDGKLDIAATDFDNNVVQIFLGNGDGTFSIAGSYPTDTSSNPVPQNLVAGDFNHDGKIDLAVANPATGTVGVLLGNGDGTFAAVTPYAVPGYSPFYIAAADLDGDGYLDLVALAATDGPGAYVVLGGKSDNSGTFNAPIITSVNGFPNYVTLNDLNGDGKPDMAITINQGTYAGTIEIALGNGDATFGSPVDYPSSLVDSGNFAAGPLDITALDLNGDGKLDLVYLNDDLGTVAVMTGNGDGTLNAPVEFATTDFPEGLALADINNDGAVDVLVGNDESGGVSVLLNGAGTGAAPNYSLSTSTPTASVTGGSSANYTLDLAGQNGYTGTISFSCSNLPVGASCSFNPASVIANGNVPFTTTLTLQTAVYKAGLQPPQRPGSTNSPYLLASLGGMGLFGLLLVGCGRNPRQRVTGALLGVMLMAMAVTMVGCDNDHNTPTGTAPGSYVFTVSSTGTGTNAPTHSLNLTVVVQ